MALEEIHQRLAAAAANMLDDYLAESPLADFLRTAVERGCRLHVDIQAPRLQGESFQVFIVLVDVEGARQILASIDPIHCVQ